MCRRLVNLLTLLSLAMLAATAWLYVRQRKLRWPEAELVSVYWARLHARYTVRADAGGVWLFRPRFVETFRAPDLSGRVASLVGKLANSQIEWPLTKEDATGRYFVAFQGPVGGWQPPFSEIGDAAKRDVVPALLEALEDPGRFAAAWSSGRGRVS
jgi:hypothetical protein